MFPRRTDTQALNAMGKSYLKDADKIRELVRVEQMNEQMKEFIEKHVPGGFNESMLEK